MILSKGQPGSDVKGLDLDFLTHLGITPLANNVKF